MLELLGVTETSNVEAFVNDVPSVVTLAVSLPSVELSDVVTSVMAIEEL